MQKLLALRGIQFHNVVEGIVAALAPQIHGGKSGKGLVGEVRLMDNIHESLYRIAGDVGLELDLFTYPVGAFPGNRLLRQFITQLDLKIRSAEGPFPLLPWNIEFPLFFGGMFRGERRRGKNEAQFGNL